MQRSLAEEIIFYQAPKLVSITKRGSWMTKKKSLNRGDSFIRQPTPYIVFNNAIRPIVRQSMQFFGRFCHRASLVVQMVKRLPTMRETRVLSLGREDPLAKEMAPHSSTLARKIPWTEERGRLQSMGSQRVGHDWATSLTLHTWLGHQYSILPQRAIHLQPSTPVSHYMAAFSEICQESRQLHCRWGVLTEKFKEGRVLSVCGCFSKQFALRARRSK